MNKLFLVAAMASGLTFGTANAADSGHGTITFTGSIIDAPCSITSETANQTVDLNEVSNVALKDGGTSEPKPFFIKLTQCNIETFKTVKTTFSGAASAGNPDLLGITGTAKGASIAITDGSGTLITLGQPSKAQTLLEGNNTLEFSAYLQGDGGSAAIVPGSFQSVADFRLDYQ
ncbi:fimbrial protein [Citrobacter farmeri]|uniref:fimbrial protein n=1 Tax=Citrobacter farmeri TaxID=67824 RepID=UPI0038902257